MLFTGNFSGNIFRHFARLIEIKLASGVLLHCCRRQPVVLPDVVLPVLDELIEGFFCASDDGFSPQHLADIVGYFQLCKVQQCVRITGKYTRSGCSVHRLLAALCAFAVVMAVDNCSVQLRTNLVELVAEIRHLVRTVLIAGDDLIDRVDDDNVVVLLFRAPDQLRSEFVHRYRFASQVPDINVSEVLCGDSERFVDILEAVQAACAVQLKIDVQDLALSAFETQPACSFSHCYGQLDQGE